MDDSVAVYASKVAPNEQTRLIQVVFAEDRYTGKSVKVAAEFFDKLTTGTNQIKIDTLSPILGLIKLNLLFIF